MRNLDFSSWDGALTTLLGLVIVSVVAVGTRLLLMQTIQRRRERENRQINERLRTLIAAYKILGGSFTGELSVDPTHLRALRKMSENMVVGNKVHLSELIVSLRTFIRNALDLEPISPELHIPDQGPLRPTVSSGKAGGGGRGEGTDKETGGRSGSDMALGAEGLGAMGLGPAHAASERVLEEHPTEGLGPP